ncbi:hypothetical protein KCP69_24785 [Salmonella enterica subsp. enterica]|nr:hypothetical protein KCP69_24785 [Salmonella enterica subsp. enterica]
MLGYLIAGCIIGHRGLRLVTDAESMLHFAEIGVVLMLFVIGEAGWTRNGYGSCAPRYLLAAARYKWSAAYWWCLLLHVSWPALAGGGTDWHDAGAFVHGYRRRRT